VIRVLILSRNISKHLNPARISILIFPTLLISVKVISNLLLLFIALVGAKKLVNQFRELSSNYELKIFFISNFQYFVVMFFSILLASGFSDELTHIARKIHFLIAPLILIFFINKKIKAQQVTFGLKIALISIAILIALQIHNANEFSIGDRFSWLFNANILGDILVIMIFVSLTTIFIENRRQKIFTLFAIFCGLFALFITGSRGSWITFIPLAITSIFLNYRYIKSELRESPKFFFGVTSIFLILFVLAFPHFQKVYEISRANIQVMEIDKSSYTSSGIRLYMWESALKAFKDAPWHGYGYRNANEEVSKYMTEHRGLVSRKSHLHNEYITNLLSAGYFGLVALLVFYLLPMSRFYCYLKQKDKREFAVMGFILVIGYMSNGITHIALGEENINAFYIFMAAVIFSGLSDN